MTKRIDGKKSCIECAFFHWSKSMAQAGECTRSSSAHYGHIITMAHRVCGQYKNFREFRPIGHYSRERS